MYMHANCLPVSQTGVCTRLDTGGNPGDHRRCSRVLAWETVFEKSADLLQLAPAQSCIDPRVRVTFSFNLGMH